METDNTFFTETAPTLQKDFTSRTGPKCPTSKPTSLSSKLKLVTRFVTSLCVGHETYGVFFV